MGGGRGGLSAGSARDVSRAQRSISYAPSDMETVSGMSASEYDSGDDEDIGQTSRATDFPAGTSVSGAQGRQGRTLAGPSSRQAGGTQSASTSRSGVRKPMPEGKAKGRRGDYFDNDDADDRFGPLDDEDDEVQPMDRGEELIKRRHKERKEKKRREQAEKRRQSQATGSNASTSNIRPSSTIPPSSPRLDARSPGQVEREARPMHISLPPPQASSDAPLSPGALASPGAIRNASSAFPASMQQQQQDALTGGAYPSPHGHIRRPPSMHQFGKAPAATTGRRLSGMSSMSGPSYAAPSQAGTVTAGSGFAGDAASVPLERGPSIGVTQSEAGVTTGDVFSDDGRTHSEVRKAALEARGSVGDESALPQEGDEDEYIDEQRDEVGGLATERRRTDTEQEDPSAGAEESPADGEADVSPGSGSGDEGDDVEYTLKDRQDAINIEHPFGLPIWKPALYKKSRSVTRDAETALHSIPSAAAERHLLPGNILWTVLFGSWLSIICFLSALVLSIVPKGGRRYARVLWELGGYIFWPFGKYVELEVSPASGERQPEADQEDGLPSPGAYENSFTPVAARFPHDHLHQVPFNSRATRSPSHADETSGEGSSSGSRERVQQNASESHSNASSRTQTLAEPTESSALRAQAKASGYGTINGVSPEQDRIAEELQVYGYVHDEEGVEIGAKERWLGRLAYGLVFWTLVAPLVGIVCLLCWGGVFTIPMAKLSWVLIKNLASQPLALHFRSAAAAQRAAAAHDDDDEEDGKNTVPRLLRPGQLAPRSKSFNGKDMPHRRSKILLCTYRAVGAQYYKYTVGGVNILFVNTLPLVFFTIFDAFFLEPYVEHHRVKGVLAALASQSFIFVLALGSVIPLSYFIGMAVASISAQSSIGMGAVINATFGSIIEIILYALALTQNKAKLVEGSIVGSLLAGVLLMPGLSMCSGATRRKEQRFNARSAGVTSTMLIMAIIGILTPTLFYQIYGTVSGSLIWPETWWF